MRKLCALLFCHCNSLHVQGVKTFCAANKRKITKEKKTFCNQSSDLLVKVIVFAAGTRTFLFLFCGSVHNVLHFSNVYDANSVSAHFMADLDVTALYQTMVLSVGASGMAGNDNVNLAYQVLSPKTQLKFHPTSRQKYPDLLLLTLLKNGLT